MAAASRAVDVFLIVCFFLFAVIALTIGGFVIRTHQVSAVCYGVLPHCSADLTQAWFGKLDDLTAEQRFWPPPVVVEYYTWWCKNVDPLLAVNPLW